MKKKRMDNAKLGLFVMAGVLFLIFSLYMIGKNRSMFSSTFVLYASFSNINGLVPGNNIRFSGIDVGTVRRIDIRNDTSIMVMMVIDKKVKDHVRKNALASIGTDGLMGNKLVNINSQAVRAELVVSGDTLQSRKPVETDEMLRTLNTTNENIAVISGNLKEITRKLNSSRSLWNLLADSVVSQDVQLAVAAIRKAGTNTERFTREADDLVQRLKGGEGLAGALIMDTLLVNDLRKSLEEIHVASQNAAYLTVGLKDVIEKIEHGEGPAGMIVSDTAWSAKLYESLINIEEGTARFNENMEAMRHSFLFRGYFKKQDKDVKKKEKEQEAE